MKIKKLKETLTSYNIINNYEVETVGEFMRVNATLYSTVSAMEYTVDEIFYHEVTDIELSYIIDGKKAKQNGVKELYDKLFGEGEFIKYRELLLDTIEKQHLINSEEYPNMETIKPSELHGIWLRMAKRVPSKMYGSIRYTDAFDFLQLTKRLYPELVLQLDTETAACNSGSSHVWKHSVVDITNIEDKFYTIKER
jgi:hypothetical protein